MQRYLEYSLKHSAAFIMDEIQLLQEKDAVLLVSYNESLIEWITNVCAKLNFSLKIFGEFNEEISHFNLLILDLGIESETPVLSANGVSIDETFPNTSAVGQIAIESDSWARKAQDNNSRVLVIRSQNWAVRSLVRNLFSVPLFNNYSGILTGQAKSKNSIKRLQERVLLNGVSFDYGVRGKDPFSFRVGIKFLNQLLTTLGPKNSLRIKKYLKSYLRF